MITAENPEAKYIGVWYVYDLDPPADFLVTAWTLPEDNHQRVYMEGRLRSYDPEDPGNDAWSGRDEKKWFSAKSKEFVGPEEGEKDVDKFVAGFVQRFGGTIDYVPVHGDAEMLITQMQTRDWCHVKTVPRGAATGETTH